MHRKHQKISFILLSVLILLTGCQKVCSQTSSSLEPIPKFEQQGEDMQDIYMKIKQRTFQIHLYDNQASKEFVEMLPMTVTMNDLNRNEKYIYLDSQFSTQIESVDKIEIGDLMLFKTNCLVLFYDSFPTTYEYTRIGYIENKDDLRDALKGDVIDITFELKGGRK